jgi:hypothetical protein
MMSAAETASGSMEGRMEGYTARDVLIVMRLDLSESLQEIESELAEVRETLEFSGIARQMLGDDQAAAQYPAIKRWLETVSNEGDLQRDLEELQTERDELRGALAHLEGRLTGKSLS